MTDNSGMPAYCNLFVSKPRHAFTNIIYIFAGDCHNDITRLGKSLFLSSFLTNIGQCFFSKKSIIHIDLPIVNARNAIFSIIFFLKTTAPAYCSNIAKSFVLDSIGAVFLN